MGFAVPMPLTLVGTCAGGSSGVFVQSSRDCSVRDEFIESTLNQMAAVRLASAFSAQAPGTTGTNEPFDPISGDDIERFIIDYCVAIQSVDSEAVISAAHKAYLTARAQSGET